MLPRSVAKSVVYSEAHGRRPCRRGQACASRTRRGHNGQTHVKVRASRPLLPSQVAGILQDPGVVTCLAQRLLLQSSARHAGPTATRLRLVAHPAPCGSGTNQFRPASSAAKAGVSSAGRLLSEQARANVTCGHDADADGRPPSPACPVGAPSRRPTTTIRRLRHPQLDRSIRCGCACVPSRSAEASRGGHRRRALGTPRRLSVGTRPFFGGRSDNGLLGSSPSDSTDAAASDDGLRPSCCGRDRGRIACPPSARTMPREPAARWCRRRGADAHQRPRRPTRVLEMRHKPSVVIATPSLCRTRARS